MIEAHHPRDARRRHGAGDWHRWAFFRARDPDSLSRWYAAHLGVDPAPESYEMSSWWQQEGPTVFTAMASDSEHFGNVPSIHGRSTSGLWTLTPWCVSCATRRSRSTSTPSIIRTVASRTCMIPKGTPSNCGSRPVLTSVARPDPSAGDPSGHGARTFVSPDFRLTSSGLQLKRCPDASVD